MQAARFRVEAQWQVAHNGDEPLVQFHLGLRIDQTLARLWAGNGVEVGIELVQAAKFLQQFRGRLFTHARHTGNIIRRVTGERFEIDKLGRG